MGQAHVPERRVARKTYRYKLTLMERPHGMDDEHVRLGRNLAAAFIATCQGIGLDYARKKYAGQPSSAPSLEETSSRWRSRHEAHASSTDG